MGWMSASVAPRSGVSTPQKKKIGARSVTDQVDNGLKLLGPLPLTDGKVYVSSPFRNVQKLVQSGSRGAGAFWGEVWLRAMAGAGDRFDGALVRVSGDAAWAGKLVEALLDWLWSREYARDKRSWAYSRLGGRAILWYRRADAR